MAGGFDGPIKKLNRDTLMVKVKSKQQGDRLKAIDQLAGIRVVIDEYRMLNGSKGTVLSKTMSNTPIDVLMDALKSQNVIGIERMKTKVRGQLQETHRYILT